MISVSNGLTWGQHDA